MNIQFNYFNYKNSKINVDILADTPALFNIDIMAN